MQKKLLAGTVLGGLAAAVMATAASAADLPRKTAPQTFIQPVPIFTWTGFYVGVSGGYVFEPGNSTFNGFAPALALTGNRFDTLSDGFILGGTIGYNYQINPNFVVGLEADLSYTDVGKSVTNGFVTISQDMTYLGTVRGRLGLTFDRFMIYGTGGLAFANIESSTTINGLGNLYTGKKDDMRAGYTIGGGVEYAFTNNLSAKVEYLYYDLGTNNYNSTLVSGAGFGPAFVATTRSETRGNIVRAGLNYRF